MVKNIDFSLSIVALYAKAFRTIKQFGISDCICNFLKPPCYVNKTAMLQYVVLTNFYDLL